MYAVVPLSHKVRPESAMFVGPNFAFPPPPIISSNYVEGFVLQLNWLKEVIRFLLPPCSCGPLCSCFPSVTHDVIFSETSSFQAMQQHSQR